DVLVPHTVSAVAVGVMASCAVFFFFQAEDGIRDLIVTGVQTCALPIFDVVAHPDRLTEPLIRKEGVSKHDIDIDPANPYTHFRRSEERRVGKECRSRWWPYQ